MVTRPPGGMSGPSPSMSEAEQLLASIERELAWLSRTKRPEFTRTIRELEQVVADIREALGRVG